MMTRTAWLSFMLIPMIGLLCGSADVWAASDLSADGVDTDENKIYRVGGPIHVDLDIHNHGTDPSGSYRVNLYASTKAAWAGETPGVDYFIGSAERGPVGPDQYDWFSVECVLPSDMPEGRYVITLVIVDPTDSEPGNNRQYQPWTIRVIIPSPNLAVQSVDAQDGYYRPGDEVSVSVGVKNLGELDSGGYTISCRASTSSGASTGGLSIGDVGSGALGPGEQTTVSLTGTLPASIPAGEYFIKVVVACAGDDDLKNNSGYDSGKIPVGSFADLAVVSVQVAPGTYSPGDAIVARTIIKNVGDLTSAGYSIQYYISTDTVISSRDYSIGHVECNSLAEGQQRDLAATCQLPSFLPIGTCYVGAVVTSTREAHPLNNVFCDGTGVTLVLPAAYVCGQARYEDNLGWSHPIRYARVKVYDSDDNSDPTDDPVIGESYTDGDGNYGVRLTPAAGSGPEVYVKILTEGVAGACPGTTSPICTVKDHVLKQVYSLRSINYPYPYTTSTTISLTSPRTSGAFMVYDSVVEGFEKTRQFFDVELDGITTYWPTSDGGTYYWPGQGIFVSQDDRGDRDVILHEYGHFVADSCGFALGSVGEDPVHYWNLDLRVATTMRSDQEARNLSFRESWATLFGVATQFGDSGYPYTGDCLYQDFDEITRWPIIIDLETVSSVRKTPGQFFECMTCGALWDIFDDKSDPADNNDTLSDPGLARIWMIASQAKPADILDFWNAWFSRYEDYGAFNRIFWDHEMSFRAPVSTPTVETFESGDFSALAWERITPQWTIVPGVGRQGSFCAKAGTVGDGQSTTLEVTMDCDDGYVYFWVKTSCEQAWDVLRFFVDGTKKDEWSGETDWRRISFPVAGGKRKFTWTYIKDKSGSQGADTAWIDDIEFPRWETDASQE